MLQQGLGKREEDVLQQGLGLGKKTAPGRKKADRFVKLIGIGEEERVSWHTCIGDAGTESRLARGDVMNNASKHLKKTPFYQGV